ncbi:uncharacterized protein LOC126330813 [Schistocerca gregaria]|uniref:uncharacterized protein LOC126330813 n=1 Tax=Schistocerca gregaria TaxID=7010 RepID=UPI00211E4FB0|nr:uncharacterized protein LOC126330813 [Schistocerca gregaria]
MSFSFPLPPILPLLLLLFTPLLLDGVIASSIPHPSATPRIFSCDYPKVVPSASLVHSTLQNRQTLNTCPSAFLFHAFYLLSGPTCVSCTGGGSFFWTHGPSSPPASICLPKPLYPHCKLVHTPYSTVSRSMHSGIYKSLSHSSPSIRSNLSKQDGDTSLSEPSDFGPVTPNNHQVLSDHQEMVAEHTFNRRLSYDSCRVLDCSDPQLPSLQYPHCPVDTFCNVTTSSCQRTFTAAPPCSPMLYSVQLQKCVACHTSNLMPSPLLEPKRSFTCRDQNYPPHFWIASYRCNEQGEFAMPLDNANWETVKKAPRCVFLLCILTTSLLIISLASRQYLQWRPRIRKAKGEFF